MTFRWRGRNRQLLTNLTGGFQPFEVACRENFLPSNVTMLVQWRHDAWCKASAKSKPSPNAAAASSTVADQAGDVKIPIKASVGITAKQPGKRTLLEILRNSPEVLECHHVAGADSYLLTVVTTSMADLERFIGTINGYGETRTSIVFSTPIERRGLVKPGTADRS